MTPCPCAAAALALLPAKPPDNLRADERASLRPAGDRAPLAGPLGLRAHVGGGEPRGGRVADGRAHERAGQLLRAGDAALPERRASHRASEVLLARRRDRPLPPPPRQTRAAPDGLRRLRAARGEPRDQDGRAPARLDRRVDRRVPAPVPRMGDLDRLVARARDLRTDLLPLDAVDLPRAVQGRARVPSRGRREVVPERPDRARQRAGRRGGALRALRPPGGSAPARAVVPAHHRLRRAAAHRPRHDRLARARQDDAAQLDRAQRGRRGDLPLRGAGRRLPRLHDTARHAVRRHVLRDGARAPRRAAARRGDRARAGGARLRQPRAQREQRGTGKCREGEDGGSARPDGHQPRQRRADPDVRRRLRADGVRHRGDHGGARARRARLRLRHDLRPADPARDRAGRR